MAEEGSMGSSEVIIKLDRRIREDGSVMIVSENLPLFCVVGHDSNSAVELAMDLLPEYLRANVPEFVDLRPIASADNVLLGKNEHTIPAYVIARMGEHVGRSEATKTD